MTAITKFLTALSVVFACGVPTLPAANVPEPETILYGKVLHRAHGNEHRLVEGTLEWTLRNQDGVDYIYTAELEDIEGVFSYKVSIPHQALSTGLNVDPDVIPLGVGENTYEFVSITVNDAPAAILWSEVDFLSLIQNARAETHRIDLLVSFDMLDSDGDGMPDWWEKFYGLDWQTPDGGLDSDGDGWTNLEEFLRGTNPLLDDRLPSVQTLNLSAFGESDNGVWLRAVDANSDADELVFTLTSLPDGGYLHFIPSTANSEGPETVLGVGATFTQAQLNLGQVAYRHTDPTTTETLFAVTVGDGVTTSEEVEITIDVFPPSPLLALDESAESVPFWWRDENVIFEAYWGLRENVISGDLVESALLYLLGKNYGWTLWDERLQTLPVTLEAAVSGSHFILGGSADDVLIGSAQGDILSGGVGADILTGGSGVDLFIVGDEGLEVITDFNVLEDVLDISDLVVGAIGSLDGFVSVVVAGGNTTVGVDRNGDGSGFGDASIRLEGIELSHDDLHRLWSQGQLLAGDLRGFASITIEGWPTEALEEGYSTADLILRRNGPTDQALTVAIAVSGSATNGVDYKSIPASVSFAANQNTATILVDPYTDGSSEYLEQLIVSVAPGVGYVVGFDASGQISIADAQQRFGIRAVDAYAVVGEADSYFQIYRKGPRDGFVELLLTVGGTAQSGQDYSAISNLVSFNSGQSSRLIPVAALPGGALGAGEASRTLSVGIRAPFDDEYALDAITEATMRLHSSLIAFDSWVADAVPDSGSMTSEEQQVASSPRTGFKALLEYALSYGLNLEDGVDSAEQAQLVPQLTQTPEGMEIEFTQRLNDPDINYVVQCSPNLVDWHSGSEYFEAVQLTEEEENSGRVRYRVIGSADRQCFIRVLINLSE